MKSTDYSAIGSRVKEARLKLGKSQPEFAHNLGISVSSLSDIENNRTAPDFDLLFKLISQYNVNANFIITGLYNPIIEPMGELDQLFKDNPFGDSTKDFIEMLKWMKYSKMYRYSVLNFNNQFLFLNKDILEEEKEQHLKALNKKNKIEQPLNQENGS